MPKDGSEVDEEKRATLRRFAALGAASPLSRLASDADDEGGSEARDAIAGYLARTPGAHFSKVRDDLKLGTGETQYHLRQLVEEGLLESKKDGDYRRFYPADRFSPFEQAALGSRVGNRNHDAVGSLPVSDGFGSQCLADQSFPDGAVASVHEVPSDAEKYDDGADTLHQRAHLGHDGETRDQPENRHDRIE